MIWQYQKHGAVTVFQTIEANPMGNTWRVSGELGISQLSVFCQMHLEIAELQGTEAKLGIF